jgi:hypothetical protein
MKKILSVFGIFLFCCGTAATSFATNNTNTAGGLLTIQSTTGAGPDLTFQPSASVLMGCFTSQTAYSAIGLNSVTTQTNGNEFGVTNLGNVSQRPRTAAALPALSAVTLPGTDWVRVGTTGTAAAAQ